MKSLSSLSIRVLVRIIRGYQQVCSPDQGYIRYIYPFRPTCGMYPSCSTYAIAVIEIHGPIRGIFRAILRILRCHPFQKNPIDLPS